MLAARRLIEVEIAAMAAKHASDSAIDAILRAVEEMEQHHEDRSGNESADRNFHLAIRIRRRTAPLHRMAAGA